MNANEPAALPTGVDILDRKLGGGVPEGTVVALSARPASQAELFLYELAGARETVYLSTVRTEASVAAALTDRVSDPETVDVRRLGDATPIEDAQAALADVDRDATVILDPVDVLESGDAAAYREFLADLKRRVEGTGAVAVLHCLGDDPTPAQRRTTAHIADLVFEVETAISGDSIVNRLAVPKFRNGQSIEDVIKLDLTGDVAVDTSRNIL
jgi:KaiC/GvpD/RAD55 family RecA-like ATPase